MPQSSSLDMPAHALQLTIPREVALEHAVSVVTRAWLSFDHFRPGQPPLDDRVRALLAEELPEEPASVLEVIDDAARVLDESIAPSRPRYFAFIGSSGLEIGVMADFMAACFDVNLASDAAAASEIEGLAGRWVASFVGYPRDGAATFTSGGTVSNVSALMAARERALPNSRHDGLGSRRTAIYCSRDAHHSVVRAAEILGIGSANVRGIALDGRRRMIPDALEEAIARDLRDGIIPVAVVATAGTTLVGAIDPVSDMAEICAGRGIWLHVDGAYGLPAAAVPSHASLFAGVARADSASVDAHKWLYLPKACSVCMVRNKDDLISAFGHDPSYLPRHQNETLPVDTSLEYSRPFRALKYWLAFRTHGAAAFRNAISRNLEQALLFHRQASQCPEIEVLDEPQLSVVPFRHRPYGVSDAEILNDHNRRLAAALRADGRVWIATAVIDGDVYLRPCFVNFRSRDDDILALIEITREIGEQLD